MQCPGDCERERKRERSRCVRDQRQQRFTHTSPFNIFSDTATVTTSSALGVGLPDGDTRTRVRPTVSSPSNNDESINGWMWFQECLPTKSRDWLGGKAEVTQALESGRSFHQSRAQRRLRMTRTWQERYRVSSNYSTLPAHSTKEAATGNAS